MNIDIDKNKINAFDLKLGDPFWESCQYGNVKGTVITEPVVGEVNGSEFIQFTANITYDGIMYEDRVYKVTKGFEHYGPHLYHKPVYLHSFGKDQL